MQQEGDDGRGVGEGEGGGVTDHQDRRLKAVQGGDGQVQQQQPQPQRCPRCESPNTKFCYYNNYSLSQPRYFCKTCRRYWTQGGTLRNVPVGGGCRKGKRAKTAASSSNTTETSSRSLPPPHEVVVQPQPGRPNIISSDHPSIRATKDLSAALVSPPPAAAPGISPYYQGGGGGGGYLSSLAAIQLNPSQPNFNQGLNVGTDAVGSSNLGLLSGFNVASLGPQRQIRQPSQFFQMGSREREMEALFPVEQRGLVQSTMANHSTSVSHHDWSQSFITNATNHRAPADTSLWSTISTSSISGNSESNANSGSSSLIPNHWPDLPGYGPPP